MTGSDSSDIYYVYLHRKQTTGEIFYVGKGKDDRAYKLIGRNRWWKNIVKKHGYTVEFVCKGIPEEQAVLEEKRLIAEYGRLDLGTGCLCNLTDGGEGSSGARVSEESRRKRSASLKGKNRWARSEATKQKLRKANLGKKLSEETRRKISEAHMGKKFSEETLRKRSIARKGKPLWSEEQRRLMSEQRKGRPSKNKGIPCSEETKRKISEKLKGRPGKNKGYRHTEETKLKISINKKGKKLGKRKNPVSAETGLKISLAKKGKPAHNKGKPMPESQRLRLIGQKRTEEQKRLFSQVAREKRKGKGYLVDKYGRFFCQITVATKRYHIGNFDTKEEARQAYIWCREQLLQNGEVDISRFRKQSKEPLLIRRQA